MPTMRILVADDDTDMRELITTTLAQDGYEVVQAKDGADLLTKLAIDSVLHKADPFQLVLSDIRMPLMSGLDVAKRLSDAKSPTPLVLMTAFGDAKLRDTVAQLGFRLLEKPFDIDDLLTVVRSMSRSPDQTGK